MARTTSDLEKLRRGLYEAQRGIGDFQAAERGPAVLGKRLLRRDLTRMLFRALREASK